jgi:hypothetical protein
VASNDDSYVCGKCSAIDYTVPGDASVCEAYTIFQGCSEMTACSGHTEVAYVGAAVVSIHDGFPTMAPSDSTVPVMLVFTQEISLSVEGKAMSDGMYVWCVFAA